VLPNIFDGIIVEGLAMFAGGEQVEPIGTIVIEEVRSDAVLGPKPSFGLRPKPDAFPG
jgi:hypothetical protein